MEAASLHHFMSPGCKHLRVNAGGHVGQSAVAPDVTTMHRQSDAHDPQRNHLTTHPHSSGCKHLEQIGAAQLGQKPPAQNISWGEKHPLRKKDRHVKKEKNMGGPFMLGRGVRVSKCVKCEETPQ